MSKVNQSPATSEVKLMTMTELAYTAPSVTNSDEIDELSDSELEIVSGGQPGKYSPIGLLIEASKSDQDRYDDCMAAHGDDSYGLQCQEFYQKP
jgi:hypothetical protein